jgi:hypothetical protein
MQTSSMTSKARVVEIPWAQLIDPSANLSEEIIKVRRGPALT